MGGVSGPKGSSKEPREDQRAGVQRGETVNTDTVNLQIVPFCTFSVLRQPHVHVFLHFSPTAGHHAVSEEGSMEVPPGLLSMEQHSQGKRGHSASQNVSVCLPSMPS